VANQTSLTLPQGYSLSYSTDAVSSGHIAQIDTQGTPTSFTAVAVSSTGSIGPFNDVRTYRVTSDKGTISYTIDPTAFDESTSNITITGGTISGATITLTTNPLTSVNVGTAEELAGLEVDNTGNGIINQAVLTLTNIPVQVVSVSTGAGVGGTLLWAWPAQHLYVLGACASLSLSIAEAEEENFTDGTPEGQLAIGSAAPVDADALGTDNPDDDYGVAVDFTMTDYVDSNIAVEPAGVLYLDNVGGTGGVYVNVYVDAGDIDNDVTTEVLVSGTIKLTYINLGFHTH